MTEFVSTALNFAEHLANEGKAFASRKVGDLFRQTVRFLTTRARAYQLAFPREAEATRIVLEDLAEFCRAEHSCFDADPRVHALLEGRREVWLRIMSHLNRTPLELNQMFGGPKLTGEYVQ